MIAIIKVHKVIQNYFTSAFIDAKMLKCTVRERLSLQTIFLLLLIKQQKKLHKFIISSLKNSLKQRAFQCILVSMLMIEKIHIKLTTLMKKYYLFR